MKKKYNQDRVYYVYAHYRPGSDIPFNIGKGTGKRAWKKRYQNLFWTNIVNKYGGFDVQLLLENLTEYEALCMEAMYINAFGRRDQGKGPLVNLTDGGDNPPSGKGGHRTIEQKEHLKKYWEGSFLAINTNTNKKRRLTRNSLMPEDHVIYDKKNYSFNNAEEARVWIWIVNLQSMKEMRINKKCNIPNGWKRGRKPNSKYTWKTLTNSGEETTFPNISNLMKLLKCNIHRLYKAVKYPHRTINGYHIKREKKCH